MDNLTVWKDQFQERTLYGSFVTYALPDIAELTAMIGFDFIVIDNEHGVIEQSTRTNTSHFCPIIIFLLIRNASSLPIPGFSARIYGTMRYS